MKIILWLIAAAVFFSPPSLPELRELYQKSAKSEAAAKSFLNSISAVNDKSAPVLICYKGVAEIVQARYLINPLSKLNSFKKGKEILESGVAKDPRNLEARYLRFTIQTNVPRFLNYSSEIPADKKMLIDNVVSLKDKELKQMIVTYLRSSSYCTEEEKKSLL